MLINRINRGEFNQKVSEVRRFFRLDTPGKNDDHNVTPFLRGTGSPMKNK